MTVCEVGQHRERACPFAGSVVAGGDGRLHLAALIGLDREQVAAFATAHGMRDLRAETHSQGLQVINEVTEEIARGTERLSRVKQVRAHRVLPMYRDTNGEELTATTTVWRKLLDERYATEIDALNG
ncbi:hypothetical protein ACMHYT_24580 [Rhodococcus qingshengii]|uniref:hypothetical protein n=1 Tax=Rhodococcus qingshengii TaxID=334542 RepID=UPI001878255A|nr:hypothetical protein [Rhodococcus qingshengii]QOS60903.1 hypothetical protein IM699_15840 [Rhodococcus qingshengii]